VIRGVGRGGGGQVFTWELWLFSDEGPLPMF